MNRDSIVDFLGFIIVKLTSLVFCLLPLGAALWLGRRLGDTACFVNSKRRSIAYANLKSAFPEKNPGEIKSILRSHFRNLGMSLSELLKMPALGRGYLSNNVTIEGLDRVDKALGKGKGVILLTAHFGSWEIGSLAVSARGYKVSAFAREQKYTRLNNLLNEHRRMTGGKVVTKGFSVREIIKTLNDDGIVAMLGDQDAGAGGVFVDFFNRPASIAQGVANFALKTGATILPSFIRRVDCARHVLEIKEPVDIVNTGEKNRDIKTNLENISALLENYIRGFPEQWLWSHKRWKSTPHRTVLILSDKKAGHINQSMAVADMVRQALAARLEERGIKEEAVVSIHTIELRFRSSFARALLDVCSLFAGKRCQGCLRCMRFCLTRETFDELKNKYADVVISCGAGLVAANIFLKYENNAKAIVIMKPGMKRDRRFDLVILPRHDASVARSSLGRPGLLVTEAAPNRITDMAIEKAVSDIASQDSRIGTDLRDVKGKGLGVLIGGDRKGLRLKKETVEKVVEGVLKVAEETGLDIFITTSRRTSAEIGMFLKERLGNSRRCRLLVIANEKNIEGVVPVIFGLSNVIITSPDSISMISEAASSGRYTVVFKAGEPSPAEKGQMSKHDLAVSNLEAKGHIKTATPDGIYDAVKEILTQRPAVKKLTDRQRIIERLKGVL